MRVSHCKDNWFRCPVFPNFGYEMPVGVKTAVKKLVLWCGRLACIV
jgi:hypothetical protein